MAEEQDLIENEANFEAPITTCTELIKRFQKLVRAIVARRVSDPASQDDAVFATFQEAAKSLPPATPPDRWEAWITSIALRRGIDAGRRKKVQKRLIEKAREIAILNQPAPSPSHRNILFADLDELRSRFREVLRRVVIDPPPLSGDELMSRLVAAEMNQTAAAKAIGCHRSVVYRAWSTLCSRLRAEAGLPDKSPEIAETDE